MLSAKKIILLSAAVLELSTGAPTSAKLMRNGRLVQVPGGLDFDEAVLDKELGKKCLMREDLVESVEKVPKVECAIRSASQCFTSYVTKFRPHQEQICDEKYVKTCHITFSPKLVNTTVQDCFRPVSRNCSTTQLESEHCVTEYHSVCSAKHLPDSDDVVTDCDRVPRRLCGRGCQVEGGQECHDKVITSVVQMPEEKCDLAPEKSCRLNTRLVPELSPVRKCWRVPRHFCHQTFIPRVVSKPVVMKWCFDEVNHGQEDTNPVLDTRLLLSEDDHDDDNSEEDLANADQIQNTNSLLDARLLFDEELLNLL